MFDYIKGELVFKGDNRVVVENNGIGYSIITNERTISLLNETNSTVKIFTQLIHREDSMFLVGFIKKEDRVIFDILTSLSGIGTKVALILLNEFSGSELIDCVMQDDYKTISRAKGVGTKLAQKIILELKGKFTKAQNSIETIPEDFDSSKVSASDILEVQSILLSLGYSKEEFKEPMDTAIKVNKANTSEDILKETLKILSER